MKRLPLILLFLLCWTAGANATAKFLVLCTTSCTWDNTNDAIWSLSSGGLNNTTHPVAGDTVTLDASTCVGGVTCTITVNANLSMASLTMGTCTASTTGCILDFSANNNNVTLAASGQSNALNISGTGTRNLKMGNGTWTMSSTSGTNMINAGNITNLTFTANSSLIVLNMTNGVSGAAFNGNTLTFNSLTVNANTSKGSLTISAGTITTLAINGFNRILFAQASLTIGTWTMIGTSSAPISVFGCCENGSTAATINNSTSTSAWVGMRGVSCGGAGTLTMNNSLDEGDNAGCVINAPNTAAGSCILGGWLFWRDLPDHINDNFPAWIERAG